MTDLNKDVVNSDFFVIAEIGMNHDGSFGNALKLIEFAKKANVNAVKFQLHISEEESLISAPKPPYFQLEERFDYFKRTSFTKIEWKKLRTFSHKLGIHFIVSPFSTKAVDLLENIEVDGYKIASGEVTNLPLLEYINTKEKPVLLSSGMSNWNEIDKAVNALQDTILVLFQCSSIYPTQAKDIGLNVIKEMKDKYNNVIVGFSDHTLTNIASIAAYLMGARVFEKHFTISKDMYGPDAQFSLEPRELKGFVEDLMFVSKATKSKVNKDDLSNYKEMKYIFEKSIVARRRLNEGDILQFDDLSFKKPGDGIRADNFKSVLGKRLLKKVEKDDKIFYDILD